MFSRLSLFSFLSVIALFSLPTKASAYNEDIISMRTRDEVLAGVNVTIAEPEISYGVTFLLPGAMVAVSEYNTIRDELYKSGQTVISFFINVLFPVRDNHRKQAKKVKRLFNEFRKEHSLPIDQKYNIVGHSAGGKIALVVLAYTDPERVETVIALDPVDQVPPEFTGEGTLSLEYASKDNTVLTLTNGGLGISEDHNAEAIHQKFPDNTELIRHKDAGHFAYCDNGGGMTGWLMPDTGTPEGNALAKEDALRLVREYIGGVNTKQNDDYEHIASLK